mmetsp:Transcript_32277/g.39071  ORF Transcript_32277/g.39071 Transcript_32277/m.39071 type:complete len:149 (+) Transcript_32277:77-523(+)
MKVERDIVTCLGNMIKVAFQCVEECKVPSGFGLLTLVCICLPHLFMGHSVDGVCYTLRKLPLKHTQSGVSLYPFGCGMCGHCNTFIGALVQSLPGYRHHLSFGDTYSQSKLKGSAISQVRRATGAGPTGGWAVSNDASVPVATVWPQA